MNEHKSQETQLSLDEAMRRLKAAKISRYDHGGARVYYEDEQGNRDLIMDIYGEGHYRDLILGLIGGGFPETCAILAPETPATYPESEASRREFAFDRYRDGRLMAEGIVVHAANIDEAIRKAHELRPDNRDTLVLRPAEGDGGACCACLRAARAAAMAAELLQASAVQLVERMIAEGRSDE